MKKIVLSINIIVYILISCKSKINHYEGYVCDAHKKPINGLKVFSKYDSIYTYDYTDSSGFFKIKINTNTIFGFLMIKKRRCSY